MAGTLGGAALIGAILLGATGIIVSPVVWETVLLAWFVLSFALVAGNGYWRGGLAAGYALVFAPVIGGAAGAVTVGTFTGYGFTQVTAVLFGVVLVPLTGGVGHSGRKAREAWL